MHPVVRYTLISCMLALTACASAPPQNSTNICSIFEDRRSWYKAARKSEERWGVPLEVNMAFIYHESGFRGRAKPPRRYFLGFIPGPRASDAFGYAQARDNTWNDYQVAAGNWGARRSNFKHAVDFVGWYNDMSYDINAINKDDAYNLYLAYHEGNGGFRSGTYKDKAWLLQTAATVRETATRYSSQLAGCEERLNRSWFARLLP